MLNPSRLMLGKWPLGEGRQQSNTPREGRPATADSNEPRYKAFISYSRAESRLALAISAGLEKLAKPRRKRRIFDVFLDREELPAGGFLPDRLVKSVDDSEFLILIASRAAAASDWVASEVEHWVTTRGTDDILIALAEGELEWETAAGDFAPDADLVLPPPIRGRFTGPPVWVDLRDEATQARLDPASAGDRLSLENAEFKLKMAALQAPLRGPDVVPSDIVGEDLDLWHEGQRRRRWAVGALAVLTIASVVAGFVAYQNARRSSAQQRVALSRQLASQSAEVSREQLDVALLLSIEAYRTDPNVQSHGSLINAALRSRDVGRFLHGHNGPLRSVAFNSDGSIMASAGVDGSIVLWDAATLKPIGEPLQPDTQQTTGTVELRSVAFSPTEALVAVAALDGLVYLWDVSDLDDAIALTPLDGHSDRPILALAFSADGTVLASAGNADRDGSIGDGSRSAIVLWDVATKRPLGELGGHEGPVLDMAFSPAGDTLASGSTDATIALWDVDQRSSLATIDSHEDFVSSVAFSSDGRRLVSGGWDRVAKVWDIANPTSPRLLSTFEGHDDIIRSVAFGPDDKIVASAGRDQHIMLWDPDTGQATRDLSAMHAGEVWSVAFDPVRRVLASASVDHKIAIWNLDADIALADTLHTGTVRSVLFDPDRDRLVTAGDETADLHWYSIGSGAQPEVSGLSVEVITLALDAATGTVASGAEDGTIALWDPTSREPIQILPHPGAVARSLSFNPVQPMLAAGFDDGTVAVMSAPYGRGDDNAGFEVDGRVWDLTFSPDGKQLAASDGKESVVLWTVADEKRTTIRASSEVVTSVAFSPDGDTLAVGGSDGDVLLIDVGTGQPIGRPMTGHTGTVQDIAFDPSGRILASASSDTTVILWDVGTHLPIADPLTAHAGRVFGVAWLEDGAAIATVGEDGALMWDFRPATLRAIACATANRNLSEQEWDGFIGEDRRYRLSCESLPSGEGFA